MICRKEKTGPEGKRKGLLEEGGQSAWFVKREGDLNTGLEKGQDRSAGVRGKGQREIEKRDRKEEVGGSVRRKR